MLLQVPYDKSTSFGKESNRYWMRQFLNFHGQLFHFSDLLAASSIISVPMKTAVLCTMTIQKILVVPLVLTSTPQVLLGIWFFTRLCGHCQSCQNLSTWSAIFVSFSSCLSFLSSFDSCTSCSSCPFWLRIVNEDNIGVVGGGTVFVRLFVCLFVCSPPARWGLLDF